MGCLILSKKKEGSFQLSHGRCNCGTFLILFATTLSGSVSCKHALARKTHVDSLDNCGQVHVALLMSSLQLREPSELLHEALRWPDETAVRTRDVGDCAES